MAISKEFVESVRERLAGDPGLPTDQLARDLDASEAQVITALPVRMRMKARPEDFRAIWNGVESWRNARVLGNIREHLVDAVGQPAPQGLREEDLGYIWFVSRPEPAGESHSVRFFDKSGQHLLSVYLGDDGQNKPHPGDQASYEELRASYGVKPVPPKAGGCKGCGNCSCGGKHGSHAHSH